MSRLHDELQHAFPNASLPKFPALGYYDRFVSTFTRSDKAV